MYQTIDELITVKLGYAISTLGNTGTVSGSAIDKTGYNSGTLVVVLSAATGSPTSGTVTVTVQESSDGSTFSDTSYVYAISTSNSASRIQEYSVNLNALKRYIRVKAEASFSGGTTPTVSTTSLVVLGTSQSYPI